MTDSVNFSSNHTPTPEESAASFRDVALSGDGWIADGTSFISTTRAGLTDGPLGAFAHTTTSGLDITIDSGEGVVQGAPLCRDVSTTVTLAASTTGQTVYVGWEPANTDGVVIGLAAAFTADAQKIPLYDFDTDATTVSGTPTDRRPLTRSISVKNARYEGGGTAVDKATNATTLANISAASFLRSDTKDTMEKELAQTVGTALSGTLGAGDGEFQRLGGGTSDLTVNLQGGHGRVVWAWNAYYDNANSTWRSIVASEPHVAITVMSTPGGGTTSANLGFATAAANAAANDAITWNVTTMAENGNWDFNSGQLTEAVLEHRTSRPASPTAGRIIYRTDKDA